MAGKIESTKWCEYVWIAITQVFVLWTPIFPWLVLFKTPHLVFAMDQCFQGCSPLWWAEDGEDGSPSKKEKKEGKGKAQKLEVQGDFEPDMNLQHVGNDGTSAQRQSVGSVGSMHASEVSLAEVEEQSPMASALEELPDEVSPGGLPDIPDADVDEDLQDVEEDKEEKKSKKDTGKKAKKEKKEKKDKKEKKQKKHEEEGQDQEVPSKTHPETAELEATKVPDEIEAETNPADADGLALEDIEEIALRGLGANYMVG